MTGNKPFRFRRFSSLPWLFFLTGAAIIVVLWLGVEGAEKDQIWREANLTADQVGRRLEAWVDDRAAIIQHLAGQHSAATAESGVFTTEADHLLTLYPGFQAINLIDEDSVIRIVVPLSGNEPALGRDVSLHPSRGVAEALDRARSTGEIASSPVIDLFQGGRGLATYQPVVVADDRVDGFINGVFRIDTLIDTCLSEQPLRARYCFRLRDDLGNLAYEHDAGEDRDDWPYLVTTGLRVVDRDWTLELAPSSDYLQQAVTRKDEVLALAGLLLVGLIALLMRGYFQRLTELAESQARYRLLVEHAADLIVKVDPRGRFLYVSPSYCRTFGRSENELLGREYMPLVHEEDRDSTAAAVAQLWHPPHTCYLEQRALTKDGWRWLSWSDTAVLDGAGNVDYIIGVGRDISHRKGLEEQLLQSQKMQAVGQLAGGVAHDFNNILQVMLGNLHFALTDLPEGHPVREDLEQVEFSAERASQLTRQLLAFSRQQVLQPEILDLNQLIENLLKMLGRLIGEAMQLEFRPAETLSPVRADPGQLEQVLLNLCVNARDATGAKGKITITTENRYLDEAWCKLNPPSTPGQYVALAVADDGAGIDAETITRIFDPFFTTKGLGQGTGLGLATVYGVVRQHDGFVDVQSTAGAGATFTVLLPSSEATVDRDLAEAQSAPVEGHETILLAEDNDAVRMFATRVLRNAGYEVLEATDGAVAVEMAENAQETIDLALLDVVMPRLDGRQAARRIREVLPDIRILFVSGFDPQTHGGSGETTEEAELLVKPYHPAVLLNRIRSLLDSIG